MRNSFFFLSLGVVISFGFSLSCISLKVNPLFPTENVVERIHLCKGIDERGDLLKPLDIQSEFTSEDDKIICFIQLKDVYTRIQIRWKWYSPDERMVRDTGNVIVNRDGKYLKVVTAYDMLRLNPEVSVEGQWTVVLFVNSKFIGRKIFQLKKKKGVIATVLHTSQ